MRSQDRRALRRRALLTAASLLAVALLTTRAAATGATAPELAVQTGAFMVNNGPNAQDVTVSLANVGRISSRGSQECEATISLIGIIKQFVHQKVLDPSAGHTAWTRVPGDLVYGPGLVRVRIDLTAGSFEWCLPTVTVGQPTVSSYGVQAQVVISGPDFVPATGPILP
jgi:hypothetical protein